MIVRQYIGYVAENKLINFEAEISHLPYSAGLSAFIKSLHIICTILWGPSTEWQISRILSHRALHTVGENRTINPTLVTLSELYYNRPEVG